MEGGDFDEAAFFAAIRSSGARALLIGRRALVALGMPVLTADYDFWLHFDDILPFNAALARFGLVPSHTPDEARKRGRYVLENDEHVDVLVARVLSTVEGVRVDFDGVWSRREDDAFDIALPSLDDLIATKRFGARPKDAEDLRFLERLRVKRSPR